MLSMGIQERVCTSGDALYRSRCHMAGRDGEEETAASQWPLERCIYNRVQCRGRSRQQVTNSQETHTGILRWALQTCAGSGKWQQLQLPCQGRPHGLHGHTGVRPASGTSLERKQAGNLRDKKPSLLISVPHRSLGSPGGPSPGQSDECN